MSVGPADEAETQALDRDRALSRGINCLAFAHFASGKGPTGPNYRPLLDSKPEPGKTVEPVKKEKP